jgi:hypothetical protein
MVFIPIIGTLENGHLHATNKLHWRRLFNKLNHEERLDVVFNFFKRLDGQPHRFLQPRDVVFPLLVSQIGILLVTTTLPPGGNLVFYGVANFLVVALAISPAWLGKIEL